MMDRKEEYEHIFRAYDIRGVFSKDLFPHTVLEASTIFGNLIKEKGAKTIGVSGDGRKTTPLLREAVASGIASAGVDVKKYEHLPIPVFNFKVWKDLDAGAFITASHNPPEWNGVRFRREEGTGFSKENKLIKERYLNDETSWADWNQTGNIVTGEYTDVLNQYSRFVQNQGFTFEKELKILVDPRNGMAGTIAPHLYGNHANVVSVNSHLDPEFESGSPDPVHGDISHTVDLVQTHDFDCGVIFDGDSDRSVLVDENGDRVPAEVMAIILAREVLDPGDTVVYNVSCSSILKDILEEENINTVECRVGDVFVAEALKEHNAQMGVEGSYHFFLPKYGFLYDDAIFFTYAVLSALSHKDKPLSQLVEEIGTYPIAKSNIQVSEENKPKVMEKLTTKLEDKYEINTIDGLKIYLEEGNILIRPSNTEPVIRIRTEWKDENELNETHKRFEKMITEARRKIK